MNNQLGKMLGNGLKGLVVLLEEVGVKGVRVVSGLMVTSLVVMLHT